MRYIRGKLAAHCDDCIMSKSFTPKVGAKETPTTHRKSTSKVSAKKAHPTHRKPTSQIAAEKASNTKVATETVRGTHRKVAAKFQEFRSVTSVPALILPPA
jgi:hypothetical protein